MTDNPKMIRVKFMARTFADQDPLLWLSLFKGRVPVIDGVEFTFDVDGRDYDWLVVYDDLTFLPRERRSNRIEPLSCARENTMLITSEPSRIKVYGPAFMAQFGHIMSMQPEAVTRHPRQIKQTPPLRWFYGRPLSSDDNNYLDLDHFLATPPIPKTSDLSTVCSNKQMAATLHQQRYNFVMEMKARLGKDMDLFGRGIRPINDKSEAMDSFRYHIAIENNVEPGYWTEKISDCFLAYCVPFYFGPPGMEDVFPKDSFIPIDIFDYDGAEAIIRAEIKPGSYEARLPALIEARRLTLTRYNLMDVIAKAVTSHHAVDVHILPHATIKGRHIFRRKHPIKALSDMAHRLRVNGKM